MSEERDPFAEATVEGGQDRDESLGPANEPEQIDTSRQQQPPQVIRKTSPVGAILGVSALIVALGSGAGAVYGIMKTQQLRADVNTAFTDVDENIAALGRGQNNVEVDLARLRESSQDNALAIQQLDTDELAREIAMIRQTISEVDQQLADSKTDSERQIESLQQGLNELESLVSTLQKQTKQAQASRSKPVNRTVPQAQTKAKPMAPVETLDGHVVVSVDRWGYSSNVVLFDMVNGEYVTVEEGESIGDWRYIDADADKRTAKFAKGQDVVHVKIKG